MYKITWLLNSNKKLYFPTMLRQISIKDILCLEHFPRPIFHTDIYILDNYNTITRDTRLFNLNWTHSISTKSFFYEFTIGKFSTMEHSAVQDLHWSEYRRKTWILNQLITI